MKFDFNIPPELAHLKIDDRGYPIPYFVSMAGGKPNFRFMDETKRNLCVQHKLCGICGKKLRTGVSTYQISGPLGLKNRVSSDAMMHEVCARFTIRVCPHLYYEKSERKESTAANPAIVTDKPAVLYLVRVSKWKGERSTIFTGKADNITETALTLIRYTPVSAEKYIYQDNVLTRDPSGDELY